MQCTGCSYKVACCHLAGDLIKVPCSFVRVSSSFSLFSAWQQIKCLIWGGSAGARRGNYAL